LTYEKEHTYGCNYICGCFCLFFISVLHKGFSQKTDVRDLSSINLHSYTLSNTSLTKEKVVNEIMNNLKSDPLLKHGQNPK